MTMGAQADDWSQLAWVCDHRRYADARQGGFSGLARTVL